MAIADKKQVEAGTALYSKFFLNFYDWLALGLNGRFIWKCPSYNILEMYNKYVTDNHLDIGVGTGYFMDNCRFPSPAPRLALMDLNCNTLDVAGRRLARYNPEIYQRNVLESFSLDAPGFDSVGMMNLLHCLPGDMDNKQIAFRNVKAVMNPGAVLFGSTIMYKDVERSALAGLALKLINLMGYMTNLGDDIEALEQGLSQHFSKSQVRVIGCEALFWAIN